MPINFHDKENRFTYAKRDVDSSWIEIILKIVNPSGKHVTDIGCGGGIYTRTWAQLGAAQVLGLDFSEQMIQTAREMSTDFSNISYQVGNAISTGLDDKITDIVFERALIHHISNIPSCLNEAFRLLRSDGIYIIQERIPEDIEVPASKEHIRGYFFEKFPHLLDIEYKRRPSSKEIKKGLIAAGFNIIKQYTLWETRRTYHNFSEMASDLRDRTGRSILHELNNEQIEELITYISSKIPSEELIIEKDRWTLWSAIR
ncbi:MAG: class I SAM-dependent methyltransferase [Promethearchaeota archaeon]